MSDLKSTTAEEWIRNLVKDSMGKTVCSRPLRAAMSGPPLEFLKMNCKHHEIDYAKIEKEMKEAMFRSTCMMSIGTMSGRMQSDKPNMAAAPRSMDDYVRSFPPPDGAAAKVKADWDAMWPGISDYEKKLKERERQYHRSISAWYHIRTEMHDWLINGGRQLVWERDRRCYTSELVAAEGRKYANRCLKVVNAVVGNKKWTAHDDIGLQVDLAVRRLDEGEVPDWEAMFPGYTSVSEILDRMLEAQR